jgi:hypothetical protein
MDQLLTFKQQHEETYQEMIHAPIGTSVWKFLQPAEDGSILDTFSCDPSEGTISMNKYADNTNQTNNVINRILEQN